MKSPLTTSLLQTIENASPVRAKVSGHLTPMKNKIIVR